MRGDQIKEGRRSTLETTTITNPVREAPVDSSTRGKKIETKFLIYRHITLLFKFKLWQTTFQVL